MNNNRTSVIIFLNVPMIPPIQAQDHQGTELGLERAACAHHQSRSPEKQCLDVRCAMKQWDLFFILGVESLFRPDSWGLPCLPPLVLELG